MPGASNVIRRATWPTAVALLLVGSSGALAQQNGDAGWQPREILTKETYVTPPAGIAKLVTAPRQNQSTLSDLSPDRKYFLKTISDGLPSVQTFGKPHYYFAGLQVDYQANRARVLTNRSAASLALVDATTGKTRSIEPPKGATISSASWSPDGSKVAYLANFVDGSKLYVADVATGKSRPVTNTSLLATLVTSAEWTGDGSKLVAVFLPDGRKAEPQRPAIETGPLVRITDAKKNPTRVYASLLRDPFDRELMEYYVTGQLAMVDVKTGAITKLGAPAMVSAIDPSPDGKYVRVTRLEEPFSYIVQYSNFGQREELWDARGKMITTLSTRPLREGDSPVADGPPGTEAADTARRNIGWLPNGAGLYFFKQDPAPARGAGSDSSDAPRGPNAPRRKDHLYTWAAPFTPGSEKAIHESDARMSGVAFSEDAGVAFIAENAMGTGHVYAVYMNEPGKRYTLWRMRGINASVGRRSGFFGGGGGRGGTGADSVTFLE